MIPPAAASPAAAAPAAAGAKWWGAGSGVTRTEVLYGLPQAGVELSLANGKKHVPTPTYEARSRAEIMQGLPWSGKGADLATQGGLRKFPAPPPPVRSKIEALHGLPMSGRDADIALAGGRGLFPGRSTARSGSEPPKACNETVRDLHLYDSTQACGRGPMRKDSSGQLQAVTRRASWNPYSPRSRSHDGVAGSPCASGAASPRKGGASTPCSSGAATPLGGGAASPRRGGASSPRSGGSPRAGANRRLSGAVKVCSPGGQQNRRKLSGGCPQPPISEDADAFEDRFGACSVDHALDLALTDRGCSTRGSSASHLESAYSGYEAYPAQDASIASLASGSLGSSASLASLTSELSQCLNLSTSVKSVARTSSTASIISPENAAGSGGAAVLNSAVEDVLRGKMETAWQAICSKLRIPYEAPPPQMRRAMQAGRAAPAVQSPRKVQAHPFRSTTNPGSPTAR